ncbi:MAG: ArsR/SmtB family transcription factor [Verrucomicrobiales bacterium]
MTLIAATTAGVIIHSLTAMGNKSDIKLDRDALEKIARVFRVFSEATRLQILQELKTGARNVTQLVETLGVSQANVSKQLRLLHDAGIIRRKRLGTQAIYEIVDPMTFALCGLVCEKLNRDASLPQPTFAL